MLEKNPPSFVIFGYGGTMARSVYDRLVQETNGYKLFAFDHQRVDVTVESHVFPLLRYIRPSYVINCASISDVEVCEMAKIGAFSTNSVGARNVAMACKDIGCKMISFSTSHVFDGTSRTPYGETSHAKPLNVYGKSKLQSEKDIMVASSKNLVIRTGWLFSHRGVNWLTSAINMATSGEEMYVVEKRVGSPTYTADVASAAVELIKADACGIVHVANEGSCSWAEFYRESLSRSGISKELVLVNPKKHSFFSAQYPRNSTLANRRYERITGKKMRPWMVALDECLDAMKKDGGPDGRTKE
jgi:dTDP-4-dehydrorhamnose reductase